MPELTIRSATRRDIGGVLALWRSAGSVPTVSDTTDAVESLLQHDPDALVVAELSGHIAGTVIVVEDDQHAMAFWCSTGLTRQAHRARFIRNF